MFGLASPDLLLAVLGALPFLPRGKGAAILIMGGMALLAFSLCWSMLVLRATRSTSRRLALTGPRGRLARGPMVATPPGPVLGIRLPWLGTLLATAVRSGLGDPKILRMEPTRQTVRLDDCRGCRGRRGAPGCERERAALERVLASLSPRAEVTEVACNTGDQGACTFELSMGAQAR